MIEPLAVAVQAVARVGQLQPNQSARSPRVVLTLQTSPSLAPVPSVCFASRSPRLSTLVASPSPTSTKSGWPSLARTAPRIRSRPPSPRQRARVPMRWRSTLRRPSRDQHRPASTRRCEDQTRSISCSTAPARPSASPPASPSLPRFVCSLNEADGAGRDVRAGRHGQRARHDPNELGPDQVRRHNGRCGSPHRMMAIKGSFRYGAGVYDLAISLVARGLIDLKPLVTHRYSFEEAPAAFQGAKAQSPPPS